MAKNPPGEPGLMPASAVQLRLIPSARPLEGRLGVEFFRQLPRRPGVYRMLGADGALLYVGKAGDLRQRLSSYRSLTQASRKTVRLLHAVHAITWEVCATEEAAALLENVLLRTHRPRFNRVGVWPQANGYLEMVRSGDDLRLRFLRTPGGDGVAQAEKPIPGHVTVSGMTNGHEPTGLALTRPRSRGVTLSRRTGEGRGEGRFMGRFMGSNLPPTSESRAPLDGTCGDRRLFGAFKPRAGLACRALVRLLWGQREDWPEPAQLPRLLLSTAGAPAFWLPRVNRQTAELLAAFLSGQSSELLNLWVGFAEVPGSPFLREFWRRDWELAGEFYRTGPVRNRALRERFGGGDALIGESELDDLLVRWRRA